jgi:hypothetical protein
MVLSYFSELGPSNNDEYQVLSSLHVLWIMHNNAA